MHSSKTDFVNNISKVEVNYSWLYLNYAYRSQYKIVSHSTYFSKFEVLILLISRAKQNAGFYK